ncbi:MAG: GDSL-type esterase/lipase family protein, partial [Vicinamibacteria bacterium]
MKHFPRREYVLRALLVAASVLGLGLVLVVAEVSLRLVDPQLMIRRRGIHQYHPRLGWVPRPGAHSTLDGIGVSTGPMGERLAGFEPNVGGPRVILFGDSVTFGLGVSDEHTFASLLTRPEYGYDVVNLAVPGYGPDQSLLRMEATLPGLSASIVILGLCLGNDLADVASPYHLYDEAMPKPLLVLRGGALVIEDRRVRKAWMRGIVDSSFLLAALAPAMEGREPGSPEVERRLDALRASSATAEDTLAAIVRRMRMSAQRRGARFLVVAFPDARSHQATSQRWARLKRKVESSADVLDLVPALAPDRAAYESNSLDHIGHMSAQGHEAAARLIAARLARDLPANP